MKIILKLFLTFCVTFGAVDGFAKGRVELKSRDICGNYNGHRKYIELGEKGEIFASNITVPKYIQEVWKKFNQSLTIQCSLELVTCPSCVISVRFNYANFLSNCENPKSGAGVCRCDYVAIAEPPYDTSSNIVYNCGNILDYRSKTRSVLLNFVYWNNYSDVLKIEYASENNRDIITLNPNNDTTTDESIEISSPFFPLSYPRDFSVEKILRCNIESCRIHLVFTDFQLDRSSTIEFYDTSGERLFLNGGMVFRPPILVSSGSCLIIRFDANGGSDIGFRILASYVTSEEINNEEVMARTGCGGYVDMRGGAITMMNMVEPPTNKSLNEGIFYDCIWLIRPAQTFSFLKTHISLKVETFEDMGSPSEISIIEGTTSVGRVLQNLESSSIRSVSSKNFITSIKSGFYIRMRGKFTHESRLAIVYTAFSYSKCYIGGDFMCDNQRCIPYTLRCDGFSQCGDGSDEPGQCETEWKNSIIDRRWYSHTPNYYFPKVNRFSDLKLTTLVLVVSSVSLVLVISCLLITVYRNGNRVREREELQNQLQTISQLLESNNSRPPQPDEITEPPPTYEAPPTYDEIIKIGMNDEIMKSKREKRIRPKSRRPSDPMVQTCLLEIPSDDLSDIPSTSSFNPESLYIQNRVMNDFFVPSMSILEIAEAGETSTARQVNSKFYEANFAAPEASSLVDERRCCSDVEWCDDDDLKSSPNQLWSEKSKFRKSWTYFSNKSDKNSKVVPKPKPKKIPGHSTPIQDVEIDEYFQLFASRYNLLGSRTRSEESLTNFYGSNQSIFTGSVRASAVLSQMECESCKNVIRGSGRNRRCSMCGDCIEKLYSPKICSTCNGRISFNNLKNSSLNIDKNLTSNRKSAAITLKFCNCIPENPSQLTSSIQPTDIDEIQILPDIKGKSCNELVSVSTRHQFAWNRRRTSPAFFS